LEDEIVSIANSSTTGLVQTAPVIAASDIDHIVTGRRLPLRILDFYPKTLCDQYTKAILKYKRVGHYLLQPDVKKIGKAIYDAATDPKALDDYYASAGNALIEMRDFFHPYLSPMDKLRLQLQEVWPAGSVIENLHCKLMFCGLVRAFPTGSEARPHQDMTHWDVPDSQAAKTLAKNI
jgi:hypothetical protein